MKLSGRITVEPDKCGGRPCIRGLRIRVTDILGMLAEGVSHEEILRHFPYLEPDDIKAALAYAARQADHAVLQPVLEFLVDAQLPPGACAVDRQAWSSGDAHFRNRFRDSEGRTDLGICPEGECGHHYQG